MKTKEETARRIPLAHSTLNGDIKDCNDLFAEVIGGFLLHGVFIMWLLIHAIIIISEYFRVLVVCEQHDYIRLFIM